MASPDWSAAIVHVPAATRVTVVPDTVQTGVVADVKVTVSPDVAVAVTVNGGSPKALVASAPNEMVCGVFAVEVNVAVTFLAALMVTEHPALPLQSPPQLVNTEFVPATCVRLTTVGLVKLEVHVAPQLIPAGLEVTVPVPVPAFVTVRGGVLGVPTWKDWVTCAAAR